MLRPRLTTEPSYRPGASGALALARAGATGPRRRGRGPNGRPPFRELLLRQDPRELRRARWLADTVATEHGLGEDEQFRFTFAANEAVANAIEHGAASPEGHILIRCSSDGRDLVFEVRDWGTFEPSGRAGDGLQERGRGLALMATMVDKLDVSPGHDSTVVRLVMGSGSGPGPNAVAA